MSYSSQTKEELCRLEPDSVCCLLAELSGIVSAAGSVIYRGGGEKRLSIETENNAVARRTFRLLRDVFDVQPELVTLRRSRLGGRNAYRVEISGSEASFVLEGCGIEVGQRRGVPREITVRKCCRMSFLRGVFLACGSVTDPEKEYHLEFVLEDESFAAALQRLIARFSLNAPSGKAALDDAGLSQRAERNHGYAQHIRRAEREVRHGGRIHPQGAAQQRQPRCQLRQCQRAARGDGGIAADAGD